MLQLKLKLFSIALVGSDVVFDLRVVCFLAGINVKKARLKRVQSGLLVRIFCHELLFDDHSAIFIVTMKALTSPS